jgi:peptidoglycan/xylan/chitin deacetylase (PgdA/CDA1 family)
MGYRVNFLQKTLLAIITTLTIGALTVSPALAASTPPRGDSYLPGGSPLERTPLSSSYSISRCGNTGSRVLLTYDDWSYGAPKRIVTLAKKLSGQNIGAMFFPIRQEFIDYLNDTGVNLPYKVRDYGEYNGNHTWSHPDLTTLSKTKLTTQIKKGTGGATSASGNPGYLRPPYGAYNSTVKSVAESMGYHVCTWTYDTNDWKGYSASKICTGIKNNVKPGSVILMHLFTKSYDATDCIIKAVHDKGLNFCRPYKVNGKIHHVPIRAPYPLPC